MTVVDERSRVPPLDKAARKRLAQALDREGVVAASLIGSQAQESAGPLSDVDVAVWHERRLDPRERSDLRLALADATARALGTGEVDIALLNNAPPPLRHSAIASGIRLIERNHAERVRLETRALLDYLDTAPLREALAEGLRNRVKEGRYGRR